MEQDIRGSGQSRMVKDAAGSTGHARARGTRLCNFLHGRGVFGKGEREADGRRHKRY